ncbi:hypothetical protein LguiA_002274 [Lonicera macranthoides]
MQTEDWCSREALAAPEIIFNSVPMKVRVLEVLATSYNELPHELRLCFLYLRNVPTDVEIEVNKLNQLWVAESLIPSHDLLQEESTLHLACYYLHVLASNEEDLQVMDLRLRENVVVEDKEVITMMPSSSPIRRINKLAVYLDDPKDIDNYVPPKRGVASELQSRKMQLAKLTNLETLENFDLRVVNVEDLPYLNNRRKLGAMVSSKDDLGKIVKYLVDEASVRLLQVAISIKNCDLNSEDGQRFLGKLLQCPLLCELSIVGSTIRDEPNTTTQGGVFIRGGPSGVETLPGKVNPKIPTTESNTDDDKYVPDDEMDSIWQ